MTRSNSAATIPNPRPTRRGLRLWSMRRANPAHATKLLKDAFYALMTIMTFTPAWAAGIWGGRLCSAFQYVVNSELISVVALIACSGVIILWLLDDGKGSKIKTDALRIAAGLSGLFGIATVIALVSGQNVACSIGA
ncbi:hypothetical protein [Achromobacter aloeverae]